MEDRIVEIYQSLENDLYQSALALALTIPDICGQIEYPKLINKRTGNRLVGKQYKRWFREWVEHYYADETGWTKDYKFAKKPYFTAKMCYDLRCSFLHSGNDDIDEYGETENQNFYFVYNFELCINGTDSIQERWSELDKVNNKTIKHLLVRIEIVDLCKNICRAAESYYQKKGAKYFEDKKVSILDIDKEWNKIHQLNKSMD